jgi:DNA-binding CsgD family transcriptional regulator
MLFYSIVPYLSATDVRGSAYLTLFVSLPAMAVTLIFVIIVARHSGHISANRLLIFGATALTSLGSLLTAFSDTSTPSGTLILGISAILTGVGSAVLFVGWMEAFATCGARRALIEMPLALCVAFVLAFVLTLAPSTLAVIAIAALPLASGGLLLADKERGARDTHGHKGGGEHKDDVSFAPSVFAPSAAPFVSVSPVSRVSAPTVRLFAKALAGAFLLGAIGGFFDVLAGYRTYIVQDSYGLYLLLGGFLATGASCLIAVFRRIDGVFHSYRFSLILFCLGCLLTPFMSDSNTYSNALIFGGYTCFIITFGVVCIKTANSFGIEVARSVGVGFFVLHIGEITGFVLADSLEVSGLLPPLESITLVAIFLLFVVHLCLFTEIDLVRVGIGELSDSVTSDEEKPTLEPLGTPELCELVAQMHSLSPRESDVLPLLVQGRTISRMTETLFISAGTVSTHVRHIYHKTGVTNRQELLDLMQDLAQGAQTDTGGRGRERGEP